MIGELGDLERYLRENYGMRLSTLDPREAPLGNDNLAILVAHLIKVVAVQNRKIEDLEQRIRYSD